MIFFKSKRLIDLKIGRVPIAIKLSPFSAFYNDNCTQSPHTALADRCILKHKIYLCNYVP